MRRTDLVLAVMAAAEGAPHSPVQVQKLFFLIDKKIPHHVDGPHFHFRPDDYGPFDPNVYLELEGLADQGLAIIDKLDGVERRTFRLTYIGQRKGEELLATLDPNVCRYIKELSLWVRSVSFADLVTSIYAEYPEMRANSVFREAR